MPETTLNHMADSTPTQRRMASTTALNSSQASPMRRVVVEPLVGMWSDMPEGSIKLSTACGDLMSSAATATAMADAAARETGGALPACSGCVVVMSGVGQWVGGHVGQRPVTVDQAQGAGYLPVTTVAELRDIRREGRHQLRHEDLAQPDLIEVGRREVEGDRCEVVLLVEVKDSLELVTVVGLVVCLREADRRHLRIAQEPVQTLLILLESVVVDDLDEVRELLRGGVALDGESPVETLGKLPLGRAGGAADHPLGLADLGHGG